MENRAGPKLDFLCLGLLLISRYIIGSQSYLELWETLL
jgi:hypothetical protein